jgi:hypothetical protein
VFYPQPGEGVSFRLTQSLLELAYGFLQAEFDLSLLKGRPMQFSVRL